MSSISTGFEPISSVDSVSHKKASRIRRVVVIGILLLLISVPRLFSIPAAYPYMNEVDEGHTLHRVEYMLANLDPNPHWFNYPSLLMYGIAGVSLVSDALLRTEYVYNARSYYQTRYYDLVNPPELQIIGRILVFLFSLLAALSIYFVSSNFESSRAGLFSMVLFLLVPGIFKRSDIVRSDVPALAFMGLMILFALRIPQHKKLHNAFFAGLMLGLAVSCKYNLALAGIIIFLIILFSAGTWQKKTYKLMTAVAASAAGFLMGTPFSVLAPRQFLSNVLWQARYYKLVPRHATYFEQFLSWSEVGPFLLLVALAGLVLSLRHREKRREILVLSLFGCFYFAFFFIQQKHAFQTALPIVWLLCFLSGLFLARVKFGWVLLPLLLASMVLFDMNYVVTKSKTVDSRKMAVSWIKENVPPQSKIACLDELAWAGYLIGSLKNPVEIFNKDGPIPQDADYIVASHFEDDTSNDPRGPAVAPRNVPWEEEARDFDKKISRFPVVKSFGKEKLTFGNNWRTNNVLVVIMLKSY
jgi:hypothetical protein